MSKCLKVKSSNIFVTTYVLMKEVKNDFHYVLVSAGEEKNNIAKEKKNSLPYSRGKKEVFLLLIYFFLYCSKTHYFFLNAEPVLFLFRVMVSIIFLDCSSIM